AVFAGLGDEVRAEAAEDLSLVVEADYAATLQAEPDNLVLRAARHLAEVAGIAPRARLVLTKRLPVASGIGGGSADAAATLRLLVRLWELGEMTAAELPALAAPLRGDVPLAPAPR